MRTISIILLLICLISVTMAISIPNQYQTREENSDSEQKLKNFHCFYLYETRDDCIQRFLNMYNGDDDAALFAYRSSNIRPCRPFTNCSIVPETRVIHTSRIQENSMLRLGSVTKIFTMVQAMRVGVPLQQRVSNYGFNPQEYPGANIVRVVDAATMTSGIPEFTFKIGFDEETGQFIPPVFNNQLNINLGWKNDTLDFNPRSQYCYSNTGFEVIGRIAELQSNKNMSQLLFEQFGTVAPSVMLDPGNIPSDHWPDTFFYQNWPFPHELCGYAGCLISNARDVLDAWRLIQNLRPIYPQMNIFNRPNLPVCDAPGAFIAAGDRYGRGLQEYNNLGGYRVVGHDGDYIARTFLGNVPQLNLDFVYHFANPMPNDELRHVVGELIKIYAQYAI